MIKYFSVFLLVISSLSACKAQKDSTVIIEGKQYIVVKVKAKQTLYSLSKEYAVSTDEIKAANKGLPDGLKAGENVLIPKTVVVTPEKKAEKVELVKPAGDAKIDDNLKIIRDFYKSNDSLKPKLPDSVCPTPSLINDPKWKDTSYLKIAFILPFQLELMDSLKSQKKEYQDFQIPLEVQVFIDFYEGALIALDSLKQLGYKILVTVYDDKADTNNVKRILNLPEINDVNLIIGPAYSSCVQVAARICEQKKIYMISAFSKNNELIEDHPYVIKTIPSRKSFLLAISEHALKAYPESNFILIGEEELSKKNSEIIQANMVEKDVKSAFLKVNPSKLAVSVDALKLLLVKEKTNVIILPTESEAFVTRFLNSLYKLSADYKIVVYGMEKWKNFSGVDIQHLQSLNVHLPAFNLDRYDSPLNNKMIHAYTHRFVTEPSDFAFAGYDITFLFAKSLVKYKSIDSELFLNRKWSGTMSDYYFVRKNYFSGIENTNVSMQTFINYQLVWLNE